MIALALMLACNGLAQAQTNDSIATQAETTENATTQLQNEFWGCTLGVTTKDEMTKKLESRKLSTSDYEGNIIVESPALNGFKYDYALATFADGKFDKVTYVESGLSKDDALVFSKAIYGTLAEKQTMIKTVVDGIDCYFTSVAGITCTITTTFVDTENYYVVALTYETGTAKLTK